MNSDLHESAAWRSFGLLTADEADAFDEAVSHDLLLERACQDVDRLAAAIAVTTTRPVTPRAGQLDRLHRRLGQPTAKRTNWAAISGWAAAAALAIFAVVRPATAIPTTNVAATHRATAPSTVTGSISANEIAAQTETATPAGFTLLSDSTAVETQIDQTLVVKGETKRLIQEIEVLRDKLESFQIRDRERFKPTPGMAWPIVVRMVQPDLLATAIASYDSTGADADEPHLAAMLGDALAYSRQSVPTPPPVAPPTFASAVPIYDAARDKGTLVINNLPPITPEESYNLWVNTANAKQPIYVGRLPESSKLGADSIDFSLGATAIVPSGFILTRDPQGKPPAPSPQSTILFGPH